MTGLCAGCGRPGCGCVPDDVRRQLDADRAELSDRAASYTMRANEAARLINLGIAWAECARLGDMVDKDINEYQTACEAWLRSPQATEKKEGD